MHIPMEISPCLTAQPTPRLSTRTRKLQTVAHLKRWQLSHNNPDATITVLTCS